MTPAGLRVAIAEDSAVLRDGLVQLLVDRGFVITGAVGDPAALRSSVAQNPPDVAVVDIRMPPTFTDEGLRLALELRETHEGLGILLFSQYIETRYAADLLANDAAGIGYLLKDRVADVKDFVEAIEQQYQPTKYMYTTWPYCCRIEVTENHFDQVDIDRIQFDLAVDIPKVSKPLKDTGERPDRIQMTDIDLERLSGIGNTIVAVSSVTGAEKVSLPLPSVGGA